MPGVESAVPRPALKQPKFVTEVNDSGKVIRNSMRVQPSKCDSQQCLGRGNREHAMVEDYQPAERPSAAAAYRSRQVSLIADTGASEHIRNLDDLTDEEKMNIRPFENPIWAETANGPVRIDSFIDVQLK